jgi:hypothetical protein
MPRKVSLQDIFAGAVGYAMDKNAERGWVGGHDSMPLLEWSACAPPGLGTARLSANLSGHKTFRLDGVSQNGISKRSIGQFFETDAKARARNAKARSMAFLGNGVFVPPATYAKCLSKSVARVHARVADQKLRVRRTLPRVAWPGECSKAQKSNTANKARAIALSRTTEGAVRGC